MVENEPGMPGTFGTVTMASILHDNETGIVKSEVMCDGHMRSMHWDVQRVPTSLLLYTGTRMAG